ncbi:MAG: hypothetical protein M3Q51_00355 [Pseudomonadota bacterium]|nr:hypothetical protein [Pseudomonadota bacterium]
MKPVAQIRRENLAAIVSVEGAQSSVAARLGKDKNQIYQWLLETSVDGARNIGPRSARHIESVFNKSEGWLDHDHSAMAVTSHPVGLNLDKLATSIKYLQDTFEFLELPFVAHKEVELIAGIYDLLVHESPSNLVVLSHWLTDQVKGREAKNVGQEQARSVDQHDRGARTRKTTR